MKGKKTTIEIDLDVYKTIVNNSNYINEPANDVLKRLLHSKNQVAPETAEDNSGGLLSKNVFLKNGLKLRKVLKGNIFEAIVKDGFIEFGKKKFTSPSGAAVEAAQSSVNGWIFWDYYDDKTNSWKMLNTLREK